MTVRLWSGSRYENFDTLFSCDNVKFALVRDRLANEAGIDIVALEDLLKEWNEIPDQMLALIPFLVASFLHTEMASEKAHEASAAIRSIVSQWSDDDPARGQAIWLADAMDSLDEGEFAAFS